MAIVSYGARRFLRHVELFSRYVLEMPLYTYQQEALQAIVDSVLHRRGLEFLLIFPRQSGKNEALTHLFVYLLNLLQRHGGNIVFAAVGDGVGRAQRRLEERLENRLNAGRWQRGGQPQRRTLGKASVVFLSSHPQAFARGETAHWLLVIDELQDNDAAHLEAVFEPMRAAHNATAVYVGTVRFSDDALWQKKVLLERLEAEDGRRRVFHVQPEAVIAENPAYGAFLARKMAQLGANHPTVQSEYFLKPVDDQGGLLPARRRALMRGRHVRQRTPQEGVTYVATLDVGGQDEAAPAAFHGAGATLFNPGRDYTVATIFAVERPEGLAPGPTYRAVDVFVDQGSRHFQAVGDRPPLVQRLLAFLRHWRVIHVVCDKTGVGEGITDWLAAALGPARVRPFTFTAAHKAELGSRFLAVIETGRFRYWGDDATQPLSDGWWFWEQCRHCRYEGALGASLQHRLRWGVPDSATVATPAGTLPVHDDRLLSAALVATYDELVQQGALTFGQARAVVIPPRDPLQGLTF